MAGSTKEKRRLRQIVCAPLTGDVLEIGFGTGLNLPHLPAQVSRLLAVDPLDRGRDLAAARLQGTAVVVEFIGSDAEDVRLDDHSVDAVLSTWTLCSIPDPVVAVRGSDGSFGQVVPSTSSSTAWHRPARRGCGRTG